MKNKFNYIFIPIIFAEIYSLKGSSMYPDLSSVDIYISGLYDIYNKGAFIIIFLLMLYLLISEFDRDIVVLRYKSLNLWLRDVFKKAIKSTTLMVLIINAIPIIFTIFSTNCSIIDIIVMIIYTLNQLAVLYILSFIYILLFVINRNKIFNLIGIFSGLYIPKYLLDSLRKNYITPINLILFSNNTTLGHMLIQTSIMIVFAAVVTYVIQQGILKNKYKDIIWRN
ncbi:hypothetical protein [Clostridium beijerinckii]|uniref:hypothetical protein n=1 Tax=Clostridium beijerinckii TaxID=1520 RepID=UPI00098C9D54|nr:hypothetical protein [Clostridium beijerinckii]NRT78426.1 hypothetical protein [Clostridium beijerinckii]OOM47307.1 hypothetical protein CBEIJ_28730 [Clostridium beijerinckii]